MNKIFSWFGLFLLLVGINVLPAAENVQAGRSWLFPVDQTNETSVSVTSISLPVHPVEDALTYLTNTTYNMPYSHLNREKYDSGRVEERTYTLITLENQYLKLTILPELGGRIYQAIFKPTGNNIFYQNPILKPSPWGPPEMGWWWAAGGMEWGLPVEEHGYQWAIPWEYTISNLPDGVKVELWDTTATDRIRARVAVTLPDNAALFEITPTLENPTGSPIDYKFWLNAMLSPGPTNQASPNLRIIMPTNQVTVHSTGDSRLPGQQIQAGWPLHNGVDWSLLGNWREWYGFFQYPQASGNFQAIYDEGYDEGVVRTYNSQVVQGAKFFSFGNGPHAISPDFYTNDNSSYVEMHGGIAPTFAGTRRLDAGTTFSWTERWYPVSGIGSLTWANDQMALHLQNNNDDIRLHIAATHRMPNVRLLLLRQNNNEILFEADGLTLEPGHPYYSPQVSAPGLERKDVAVLVLDSTGTLLGSYQYNGEVPFPSTPETTPTPDFESAWRGELVRTTPFNSWAGIARIWVRNKIGLPVTLASESGGWQVVNTVGSKTEYGVDALEFAPLSPGIYIITPQGLNTSFRLDLAPGTIAEVVFEEQTDPLPTATATSTPFVQPTATTTNTPEVTSTQTPTATPQPTFTPVATPTPTDVSVKPGWMGHLQREIPIAGWAGIARIWVIDKPDTLVTLTAIPWNWRVTNYTGTKLEYGPDALEFAPLSPGQYTVSVPNLNTEFDVYLKAGHITEIVFEPALTPVTPIPTATSSPTTTPTPRPLPTSTFTSTPAATPTNTPLPTDTHTPPPQWHGRINSNTHVSSNWFGVVRVSVEDNLYLPVQNSYIVNGASVYTSTCITGTKPEFGRYFCEFAPLIPGRYSISPQGINVSTTVDIGQGDVAVVIFKRD